MRSKKLLAVLAAAVPSVCLASTSLGSYITFGTPELITAVTDVSTAGTFVRAYSFDVAPTGAIDGVTFTNFNTSGSGLQANNTPNSYGDYGTGWNGAYPGFLSNTAPYTGLNATYQSLLTNGYYNNGAELCTITLTNLNSGDQYQVELWSEDPRTNGEGHSTTVSGDAGGGTSAVLSENSTDASGGVGEFVLGTFTASGTTQTINFLGSASTTVNALVLDDITSPVPEPLSLGVLSLGGLGLLMRRRPAQQLRKHGE